MASNTKFSNQTLAALWVLSLLACNVHVQSSRIHGMQLTGSCNTPESCTKSQSQLESILEPCISAAQGTTVPTPASSCCQGITSLDPSCLCQAMKLALSVSILHINTAAALAIPEECGYPVPKNCVCDGHPIPSASLN